ncbi:Flagellar biosynthesis protein, FliO [Gaiella occulta]|uniref:Flagellar biosynthesis protein, FliO n=1 Tax=Gaiella occulta TaxID=1002870 RepID=A0A7M2Z290_9ACTN|nr:flagellar biosynthetic protein FliO [Gaiella occulta]RDI75994.1 Flagellar biosynthesis protein, FliO [Gaiella occulta]
MAIRRCSESRRMYVLRALVACLAAAAAGAPAALAAGEQTPLNLPEPEGSAGAGAASSAGAGLMRLFVGMLVIVGLVLAVRWVLKTYARGKFPGLAAAADAIEVLASKPLAPNRTLYVVRLGGETLLIGSTDQAITRLRTIPPEDALRLFPPARDGFGGSLDAALAAPQSSPARPRTQWGGFDRLLAHLRALTVRRG